MYKNQAVRRLEELNEMLSDTYEPSLDRLRAQDRRDFPTTGHMPGGKSDEILGVETEKFPFFDWKEIGKHGSTILWNYGMFKLTSYVKDYLEGRKDDNFLNKIIYIEADRRRELSEQNFRTHFVKAFPKFAAWYGFSKGSSMIDKVYTIEYKGYEIPIFIKDFYSVEEPTPEKIREAIDFVEDKGKSPYDEAGKLEPYYNELAFNEYRAAIKYTRSDFKRLPDPKYFARWLVMNDAWMVQQYGKMKEVMNVTSSKGNEYVVKEYSRPKPKDVFSFWFIGDIIYDLVDTGFDKLQAYVISKGFSEATQQTLIKEEYKMIWDIITTLAQRRPTQLEFDLTKPKYRHLWS
ncbi:MAG: hypothetical protein DRP15_00450 [Candidatus Aenigmatarchaeota archaeon]|nr:MAG: hypothetical protein DRP15_00450 [Candidatus Aenigmarchaeota archaeon]